MLPRGILVRISACVLDLVIVVGSSSLCLNRA